MTTMKRIILLLCLGWMSACINVPEIEQRPPGTGSTPSDGGETGGGDAGTPAGDLTLEFTSPTESFYTSTAVAIAVEVRGGTPETLQLLKDRELLATLRTPFKYTWDTTVEAERSYKLTVQATQAGKTFTSAPVTVVVDRTNLQVASRTPAHGSTNVDYRTPIQVVFTKAVKASTISDTTVSFAVAGVLADKTFSLSSDNKTLTIIPKERPVLPASFSIGLSKGITDLAGKALVVPTTPWSFEVPDWYAFGDGLQAVGGNTLLKDPAMVLDKQGNPIVAWSEELTSGGRFALFVYKWDGKAFSPMGGVLNATAVGSALNASMAMDDDGRPVVAWQESDGFNENIYVKRWTGESWQAVGYGALSAVNDTGASPVPTPARNPSIAVRNNEIYVAWDEVNLDNYSVVCIFKSSNGGEFSGAGSNGGCVSAVPRLTSGSNPSLVLDSRNLPVVAFQEETLERYSPQNTYVMRLQQSNQWTYAVAPFQWKDPSNSEFDSGGLGVLPGSSSAIDCSLAIDGQDKLHIAWSEGSMDDSANDIQVFHSTGPQEWERTGLPLSAYLGGTSPAIQTTLKISAAGKAYVLWSEDQGLVEGTYRHLFLAQWTDTAWEMPSKRNLGHPKAHVIRSALEIDSFERPVVAWFENPSSDYKDSSGDDVYIRRYNK